MGVKNQGATVVINHHIIDGKLIEYENWLNEIGPLCKSSAGNIDLQIIRPIPNLTYNYTIIIRFDTTRNLKNWMESDERKVLIKKVESLLAKGDKYVIKTGLDFLFTENETQKTPARWKQYLVTWSAIYPLSIGIPMMTIPLLKVLGIADNKFVNSFFISGLIVFIMVFLLMPNYTQLLKKWLYK